MAPLRRTLLFGLLLGVAWARQAWAYEFSIDLRTIGQGYQVRRFAADGRNDLLSRRRLTQYLDLNVYDIVPGHLRGDDGGRNVIYFDASLRFESDFGGYMLGRPTGADDIGELKQSQIDVLYAFVGGRNVGGRLDFQLGRQIHFDLVDFYAFDGGEAILRLRRDVAVEAFAGTQVMGELPLSSPIYELDGTSAGARNPALFPGQASALHPLAGGAVSAGGEGRPWTLRFAYRRVWSSTVDPLPGEPTSGVNEEKLALTGSASLGTRAYFSGGIRYNALLGAFDDEQLALRLRLRGRQWVTLEHSYLAPNFDGDSIWNVFAAGPYRDLRASYEIGFSPEVKAYARAFARLFSAIPGEAGADAPGGRLAAGGSLGAAWRRGRGFLRGDGYYDNGYGGLKVGVDLAARFALHPNLELEGRLTGYVWRTDLNPTNDAGVVFGGQAGGRYRLGPGLRLHLLAEDNIGTFYVSQFRGLAVVEMDASI